MDPRLEEAAKELEDISRLARKISHDIKRGRPNPYARVYWLRRKLGAIVARLGVGVPAGQIDIEKHYEGWLSTLVKR